VRGFVYKLLGLKKRKKKV